MAFGSSVCSACLNVFSLGAVLLPYRSLLVRCARLLVLSVCLSSLLGSILAVLFVFLSVFFWCAAFAFLVLVSALCASSVLSFLSCPDAVRSQLCVLFPPLWSFLCALCFFARIGFIVASPAPLQSSKK